MRHHVVYRRWLVGWLGLVPLALVNGTVRAVVLQPVVGEDAARRAAALTLVVLVVAYVRWFYRRWPLDHARTSWAVGGSWLVLTVAFELGFGRYVERLAWSTMLRDYDLSSGRAWPLVLLSIAVIPALVHRYDQLKHDPQNRSHEPTPRRTR